MVVSNTTAIVTSSHAILTVNTNPMPPVFTLQPASVTAREQGNVSFTGAAVGTAPISYQWNFNDAPISGSTFNPEPDQHPVCPPGGTTTTSTCANDIGATVALPR